MVSLSPRGRSRGHSLLVVLAGRGPLISTERREERREESCGETGMGVGRTVSCVVCLADRSRSSKWTRVPCGHRWCDGCLRRRFELSVSDAALMPPSCCDEAIPLRLVDRLFDVKFKLRWNKKCDEYTASDRLYCPGGGCGRWIDSRSFARDRKVGRVYGVCSKCKMMVCRKCGMMWHGQRRCEMDEGSREVVRLGDEFGWKRCYRCGAMVERSDGCNHMKCRCGKEFCYVCGAKWKGCECPWFPVPDEGAILRN